MSKRIMNELFCLTEDIGCHIWYQDTDSGHFYKDEISFIAQEFQKKYGRELIGQSLGQFHVDYADPEDEAAECIFLGKKVYLDRLVKKGGKEDWHVRMKGVPSGVIKDKAKDEGKSLI